MPVQSSPADTNRLGESQLMLCLQGNMKQTKIIQSAIQITLGELQIVTGQDSLLHFTGYVVAVPKQKCEKYNMNNIFCWYCSFDCIHYAQKYNKQQLIEYPQALS